MPTYRALLLTAICLGSWGISPGTVFASTITYSVTADTSSVAGNTGYLDLQFEPGPQNTQNAFVDITGFSTDGALNAASIQVTGNVSGTLPGAITIDNGTQFNDYFEQLVFGNSLSFYVTLSGPALTNPDGTSQSGSDFNFGFYNSAGISPILTNDPNGYAGLIQVNLDGTTSTFTPSGSSVTFTETEIPSIPEPMTIGLFGLGLGSVGLLAGRNRSASN